MERSQRLWDELHDLFDTDDGTLPEIRVDYTSSSALLDACSLLERRAREVHGHSGVGASVRDHAALVVAREPDVDPLHVVFAGIEVDRVAVPDLGMFVDYEQLALDYRMGREWDARAVAALFDLLVEMTQPDPGARLSLEQGPEVEARFQRAWQLWRGRRAT